MCTTSASSYIIGFLSSYIIGLQLPLMFINEPSPTFFEWPATIKCFVRTASNPLRVHQRVFIKKRILFCQRSGLPQGEGASFCLKRTLSTFLIGDVCSKESEGLIGSVAMNDEGRDVKRRYKHGSVEREIRLKWWFFATGKRWRARSAEDYLGTKCMDAFENTRTTIWAIGNPFDNEFLSRGSWVNQEKKNGERPSGFSSLWGCFDDYFHHLEKR